MFDMSGGRRRAKLAGGRPLDRRARFRGNQSDDHTQPEAIPQSKYAFGMSGREAGDACLELSA